MWRFLLPQGLHFTGHLLLTPVSAATAPVSTRIQCSKMCCTKTAKRTGGLFRSQLLHETLLLFAVSHMLKALLLECIQKDKRYAAGSIKSNDKSFLYVFLTYRCSLCPSPSLYLVLAPQLLVATTFSWAIRTASLSPQTMAMQYF